MSYLTKSDVSKIFTFARDKLSSQEETQNNVKNGSKASGIGSKMS